jgi:hypothetical protein
MTLSGFRASPRRGNRDRVKRIYGYLETMLPNEFVFCSLIISDIPDFQYDWSKSVYGESKDVIPIDSPDPIGNFVTLTHYVDADLMHDIMTGKYVTGILHLVNKTPIEWYSKKQATVETATYGSEFVAARTWVQQIIDLHTTHHYLGVTIRGKSYMFDDNKSVVDNAMQVNAKLHKQNIILSFHRFREFIASGLDGFYFVSRMTTQRIYLASIGGILWFG